MTWSPCSVAAATTPGGAGADASSTRARGPTRWTTERPCDAEITTANVPPGLIAYVDDTPAGWTRVMPRHSLAGVLANRALRRVLPDDPEAWWVTCFAVDQRHRHRGIATSLLGAAVAHARSHGATAVEGHPVDTDALRAAKVSGSALFTGTMRTFLDVGFSEIARTYPSRPVMRLEL